MSTTTISWKKLRNGSWGITGPTSSIRVGSTVTVTKRDGTTKSATVAKVLWTGNGTAIASVGSGSATGSRRSRRESDFETYADMYGEGAAVKHYGW